MTSPASLLLESASRGEAVSVDDLVPLVYEELRAMAHRQLQRSGTPSLQTTALVHEAYMKLAGDTKVARRGRAYFFAAAARAIRQVLIDRARRRAAAKRGRDARPVTLDEQILKGDAWTEDLLELEDALERLEEIAPRQERARVHPRACTPHAENATPFPGSAVSSGHPRCGRLAPMMPIPRVERERLRRAHCGGETTSLPTRSPTLDGGGGARAPDCVTHRVRRDSDRSPAVPGTFLSSSDTRYFT